MSPHGCEGVKATRALFEGRKDSDNTVLPDVVPSGNMRSGSGTPGKIVVPKFENKPVEKTPIIIDKGPEKIAENNPVASVIQNQSHDEDRSKNQPKKLESEFSYTKNLLTEERRESVDTGASYEEQDWEGMYVCM